MNKIKLKKKIAIIFMVIISLPVVAEMFMVIDTAPLMYSIRQSVSGKAPYVEDDPIYGAFHLHSKIRGRSTDGIKQNLNLYRRFTLHNFKKGYIIFTIKQDVHNADGDTIYGGEDNVKCYIEKKNGKWEVVDFSIPMKSKLGDVSYAKN